MCNTATSQAEGGKGVYLGLDPSARFLKLPKPKYILNGLVQQTLENLINMSAKLKIK
jgi:hypothetical protein